MLFRIAASVVVILAVVASFIMFGSSEPSETTQTVTDSAPIQGNKNFNF